MATANDIITGALKKLGIKPSEEPLSADDAVDGLEELNDLGAAYNLFPPVASLTDNINIPRELVGDFKSVLAQRLINHYSDLQMSPILAMEVQKAWNNIWRVANGVIDVKFPGTLPKGSGNNYGYVWDTFFSDSEGAKEPNF